MAGTEPTPLGALGRGLLAGVIGTAAMTAHQEILTKLRQPGSSGDSSGAHEQQDPWEQASAPAKVAKRFIEGVFLRQAPPDKIGLLTNATHWGYGTVWGGVYGLLQGTVRGNPLAMGPLFGSGVWSMSYVQLVPMGLYELPWRYPLKTLANDLGYHVTYGLAAALGYRAIERAST
jgi:hypothetical protein